MHTNTNNTKNPFEHFSKKKYERLFLHLLFLFIFELERCMNIYLLFANNRNSNPETENYIIY
jgi:hypothetical protein